MTLHRQPDFVRRHAAAVVGDADEAAAAFLQINGDAARTGVQRVLEQLLHRVGGALDDFTGCNLVDEMIRQAPNSHGVFHGAHFTRPAFDMPAH